MRTIPACLRQAVIERANARCEYCQLVQAGQAATFHIDHIVPVAAGVSLAIRTEEIFFKRHPAQ